MRTGSICNQPEDAAFFQPDQRQRVESESDPRCQVERQQESVVPPVNRDDSPEQDRAQQCRRDKRTRFSGEAVLFTTRKILLQVGEIIDDADVGCARRESDKRQKQLRPERDDRKSQKKRSRIGSGEHWRKLELPPLVGSGDSGYFKPPFSGRGRIFDDERFQKRYLRTSLLVV